MERIPEPELMDDPAQAQAYSEADFTEANSLFLELFAQYFPAHQPRQVLDLGCGPGDITLGFARRYPACRILGIDGAEAMLAFARRNLNRQPNLQTRVAFRQLRIPDTHLPRQYDTIISNSLLHHLADPLILWWEIRRLGVPGATVLIMDLKRPPSADQAWKLVRQYATDAPPILQRDFLNSLRAAYTEAEVRQQLSHAGLTDFQVATVSDRHLAVYGRLT